MSKNWVEGIGTKVKYFTDQSSACILTRFDNNGVCTSESMIKSANGCIFVKDDVQQEIDEVVDKAIEQYILSKTHGEK